HSWFKFPAKSGMNRGMNRREFLRNSALAAAGVAVPAAFTSCAARAHAQVRRPAPSERITLGVIGFGTIAYSTVPNFLADPRVQVVAVADPVEDLPNYGYQGERRGGREVGRTFVEEHYAEWQPKGGFKGC